jgi:ribose transport system ATP-binding protein
MTPSIVLDAQHVSKSFGHVLVLDDVSLAIEVGSIHALMGENGSGKSTLIKVLSGFHPPDPGAVVLVDRIAGRFRRCGPTVRPPEPGSHRRDDRA